MPDHVQKVPEVNRWYRSRQNFIHIQAECPSLQVGGTRVSEESGVLDLAAPGVCRKCLHGWRLAHDPAYAVESIQSRLFASRRIVDGCWVWQGAIRNTKGYGMITLGQRPRYVHRVAWEVFNGPMPSESWVLHRCDNPPCFNPDHLFLGDVNLNVQDAIEKGRDGGTGRLNRDKTHCQNGHAFTPENTYVSPSGGRECRTCSRRAKAAYKARQRKSRAA